MKLLKKNEINQIKAVETARRNEEGIKIAKKIDQLRETRVEEEVSLEKFRFERIAEIQEEINELTKTRSKELGELARVRKERADLQKPLDAEWKVVRQERAKLEQDVQQFQKERTDHEAKETELKEVERQLVMSINRNEAAQLRTKELLLEAEGMRKEAGRALASAAKTQRDAENTKTAFLKELSQRDALAAARERDLDSRDTLLKKGEHELAIEQRKLFDARETLARAFNRLNKKNGS